MGLVCGNDVPLYPITKEVLERSGGKLQGQVTPYGYDRMEAVCLRVDDTVFIHPTLFAGFSLDENFFLSAQVALVGDILELRRCEDRTEEPQEVLATAPVGRNEDAKIKRRAKFISSKGVGGIGIYGKHDYPGCRFGALASMQVLVSEEGMEDPFTVGVVLEIMELPDEDMQKFLPLQCVITKTEQNVFEGNDLDIVTLTEFTRQVEVLLPKDQSAWGNYQKHIHAIACAATVYILENAGVNHLHFDDDQRLLVAAHTQHCPACKEKYASYRG